jgi:NAD(P)-dependent dehydrogenase (short-subunit alcohol dehydrogenase family)
MGGLLADAVAVVTGGASGMGRATVLRFLDEGARVVFGDLNETNAKRVLDEIADPARVHFVRTDVAVEDDVAALVASAVERFGQLDVMFNNAGVAGAYGPLTETDVGEWDRTFAILTRGPFLGTKHAARVMIAQARGGSIVNNASVAGLVGGGGPTAYSAAKAAVVNFTYNAAVELAPYRIRVNAVCPGIIRTPLLPGADDAALRARLPGFQPWPELGQPDDVAGLVLYLTSDQSRFVNGAAIRVDGGMLAWGAHMEEALDVRGLMRDFVGFTEGSTGRPSTRRRVDDGERDRA